MWTLMSNRRKVVRERGFGNVSEGQWRGIPVAIKRVPNHFSKEREESTLMKLNHRNVIKLFHIDSDEHFKHYVLELCEASLDRLFLKNDDPRKYRGPKLPEMEVLHQLAIGLEYIHQKKLIHRDIKPQNVLIWVNPITDQVLMKWSGFGLSKEVNERGTCSMSGIRGTYNWLPPEILKLLEEEEANKTETQQRVTVKSDVFAEGLVFGYFLLKGFHLFGSRMQIPKNIIENNPVNLLKMEEDDLRELIEKMLTANPVDRISSSDVVQQLEKILIQEEMRNTYIHFKAEAHSSVTRNRIIIKYDKKIILGIGDYGKVFLGEFDNEKVAVKRIKLSKVKRHTPEEKLQRLNHRNIVKLLDIEDDPPYRYYVLELCAASMDQLFLKNQNDDHSKYLEWMPPAENVLYQLAIGLYYIHKTGLILLDIKPQNVLVWMNSKTNEVLMKWGGLRLSKASKIKKNYSTNDWLAPELLKLLDNGDGDIIPTVKSNVFAQGLVFGYYLLRGQHLFGSPTQIVYQITANEPVNLQRIQNQAMRDLIKKMLEPNLEKRMTSSDVAKELEQIRAKERPYQFVTSVADEKTSTLNHIKVDVNKILGSGGYGIVFQGEWNNIQVAVKKTLLSKVESNKREEEALQKLNHPNVIKLLYAESDSENRYYAMELCAASLDELFLNEKEPKKGLVPMPPQTKVLLQLSEGLQYIHEKSLIHRDIKPQNVLIHVDSTGENILMKWADFGLSKIVNENGSYSLSKNVKGSDKWFPPEILKLMDDAEDNLTECQAKQRGTIKSDVFSEGLVFGYYLLNGQHLFGSRVRAPANILSNNPVHLDKIQPQSVRDLIQKMLEPDPAVRISSSDVFQLLQVMKIF